MRLIDADELLYVLCQEEMKMRSVLSKSNNETFDKGKIYELLLITNVIKEQPTAYDVDKVVEEINEESWEYMSDFGDTRVIDFADAIDIARRGGTNGQDKRSCD